MYLDTNAIGAAEYGRWPTKTSLKKVAQKNEYIIIKKEKIMGRIKRFDSALYILCKYDMKQELLKIAKKRGVTRAEIVRKLIESEIEKEKEIKNGND